MFWFNGIHADDMDLHVLSINREVKPAARMHLVQIPGHDGTFNVTDGTHENRQISMICVYMGEQTRSNARSVAQWLSAEGFLVFDDEPDKAYLAHAHTPITADQILTLNEMHMDFDCQPFAESVAYREQQTGNVSLPHEENVVSAGTWATPCQITITAKSNMENITITKISER